ncbi:molybdenum cofactor sulfurase [Selaginella moellendorffii]|nr:molybdenum cofactor sulfurase [Selaginella moellendorffii]|eukprot:XP_002986233.2 molybdenum cofactor sulfurase [Selaginella moellendorffii]
MFNRLSSRLRNSGAHGHSNKKKIDSRPASSPPAARNGNRPSSPANWDDTESLDSYSAFHAESLFPLDSSGEQAVDPRASTNDQFLGSLSFNSSSDDNDQASKRSWPTSSSVPEEEINVGPAVLPEYVEAEEQFLDDYEDYFENLSLDNVRKEQYSNLDLQRVVHLDYANNPLFSSYQVEEHTQFLLEEAPCSASILPSSSRLRNRIVGLQNRILGMLNASKDDYPTLVLTAGVSASFRLFAEIYPLDRSSQILVCQDAHESIRHLVSAAARSGTRVSVAGLRSTDLAAPRGEIQRLLNKMASRLVIGQGGGVVVIPAQSGLTGTRYGVDWIKQTHAKGWHALLDVSIALPAAGVVDVAIERPEFVVGSLHHALGYPPGVGFLAIRRDVEALVMKKLKSRTSPAFVEAAGVHIACEDGGMVINGLTLAAVATGLDHLESIGMDRIGKRVECLAAWLHANLKRINHVGENSRPMIKVYGSKERERGSMVVFNLVDSTGNLFPPHIVRSLAEKQNIKLGTCGFANHPLVAPISQRSSSAHPLATFRAVKISLGTVSNFQDAYRFVQFLLRFRDEEYMSVEAMGFIEESAFKQR